MVPFTRCWIRKVYKRHTSLLGKMSTKGFLARKKTCPIVELPNTPVSLLHKVTTLNAFVEELTLLSDVRIDPDTNLGSNGKCRYV